MMLSSAAAAAAAAVAAQINAAIAAQQRMINPPKQEPKIYFEEGSEFSDCDLDQVFFPDQKLFADVDINHSKNKHILTKGSTHSQIHAMTGAVVSARGRYKPFGDCSAEEPLHLHVSADTEEKLRDGVERIHKIMGPNPLKAHMASCVCTAGFEPTFGFDVVTEIQGPDGEFLNHIKLETSISEILIRGRGSLPPHNDPSEPLHVYIGALNASAVKAAKELVDNLLETVRSKFHQFCSQQQANLPVHTAQYQAYPGYAHTSVPYCPPPSYPPPDDSGDSSYGMTPTEYGANLSENQGYTSSNGWGGEGSSSWSDAGRPGGWNYQAGVGDSGVMSHSNGTGYSSMSVVGTGISLGAGMGTGMGTGFGTGMTVGMSGVMGAGLSGRMGGGIGIGMSSGMSASMGAGMGVGMNSRMGGRMGGKARYNSVGPPASITYEHKMVMAQEAASNAPAGTAHMQPNTRSPAKPTTSAGWFGSSEVGGDVDTERLERWQRDERDMRHSRQKDDVSHAFKHRSEVVRERRRDDDVKERQRRNFREEGIDRDEEISERRRRSFRDEDECQAERRRSFREEGTDRDGQVLDTQSKRFRDEGIDRNDENLEKKRRSFCEGDEVPEKPRRRFREGMDSEPGNDPGVTMVKVPRDEAIKESWTQSQNAEESRTAAVPAYSADTVGPTQPRKRRFVEHVPDDSGADAKTDQSSAEQGSKSGGARDSRPSPVALVAVLQPPLKVVKDTASSKPLLRKLPPVPTFGESTGHPGKPAGTDAELVAEGYSKGSDAVVSIVKKSDAFSMLLDEYDEDDE